MSRIFLTAINLSKNELQNAAVQNLASAPASPVKGQLYFNSTGGDNTLYWYDGTQWIAAKAAAGAIPATTVSTQAVGDVPVVGVSTNFAREDHKHGREAFGAVVPQTTFGAGSGNGAATTVARSDHVHGTPVHDAAAHSTIPLSALAPPTTDISMASFQLYNVTQPLFSHSAVPKSYVDALINGLSWKNSVDAATTANITLSGAQTVDGVALTAGLFCLVKNQTTAADNGIYIVGSAAWSRRLDMDASTEFPNATVYVEAGTVNAETVWSCTNDSVTVGTTPITFVQTSGPGTIVAGNGLTQAGNTLNVGVDASMAVASDFISRAALTGDITAPAGSNATTLADGAVATAKLADNAVTNLKLADMPTSTVKGRATAGTGDPEDLTGAQLAAILTGQFTRKYVANCLAATATSVPHFFNTLDVGVEVYRNATPWDTVDVDVERPNANNVTVRFAVAPTLGEYRIVVTG